MLKKLLALLCAATLITALLAGCGGSGDTANTDSQSDEPTSATANGYPDNDDDEKEEYPTVADFDAAAAAKAMEVSAERYDTDYSHVLYLFITNNAGVDCDIAINVDLFDADGSLITTTTGFIDAFAAGTTVAENFYSEEAFATYEYKITASAISYHFPVDNDLKTAVDTAENTAAVSITNNGSKAAKYVEYFAFFYSGGELVGTDWGYCCDSDKEIKPGDTQSSEAHCYEAFDDVKVYIHGEAY